MSAVDIPFAHMGRLGLQGLPLELEKFFKSLKSNNCSAKWDWEKVLEVLQSSGRYGSAFWGLCEAGIYHILYCKPSNKNLGINCKKLHTSDIHIMQYAGLCLSRLLLVGNASQQADKFRELLEQVVSTLLDALISAFKISDFHTSVMQPFITIQNANLKILPRLLPLGDVTTNSNNLDLALCRIYVLSSTLRGIFESGCSTTLPICLPYLCSVISAAFSVNVCDARRSSSALIICTKHLIHAFCSVVASCGINILPAAPSLTIGLVYQLEWSSQFARSHPSNDSLEYKLAVYRCLSSILDVTREVSSPIPSRIASRIISEICSDISYAAQSNLAQSLINNEGNVDNHELQICCAVAAVHLVEIFFVNHSFVLTCSLAENTSSLAKSNKHFCDYKFKQALFALSSEIHNLSMRLVYLLNKPGKLTTIEQVLVKPHFLLPLLNAAAAVKDYGFLLGRSNALHELTKNLLTHRDPLIRTNAERCFRHTFKSLPNTKLNLLNPGPSVSSFTQTEQSLETPVSTPEASNLALSDLQKHDEILPHACEETSVVTTTASCSIATPMMDVETNSELPQETGRTSILRQSTTGTEEPTPSHKRAKKRVRFEESPPTTAKRVCTDTVVPEIREEPPAQESAQMKTTPNSGDDLSIEEALSTFDDTLI